MINSNSFKYLTSFDSQSGNPETKASFFTPILDFFASQSVTTLKIFRLAKKLYSNLY